MRADGWGFLIAAAITTTPLLAVTCFFEFLSKDGPIGPAAYLVPAAVGLSAAALIAAAGRGTSGPVGPAYYGGSGCLVSLILFFSYCGWWGRWSLEFAERFRH